MQTLRLSSQPSDIETAASLLLQDQLVAFPTETVYGLGGVAFSQPAIATIYKVKGRPADNPLIVHIANYNQISLISTLPLGHSQLQLLAKHFWPGPLTIVVDRHPLTPDSIAAGLPKVAIRMPNHPIALALIRAVGKPLVAPSANLSGRPSPTNMQHVLDDLDGKIAAVINGGNCEVGIESTVLDITQSPIILRPGAITQSEIENLLQTPVALAMTEESDKAVASPGMKYRHYAPDAKVVLQAPSDPLVVTEQVLLLVPPDLKAVYQEQYPTITIEALTSQQLYTALRLADSLHKKTVIVIVNESIRSQAGLFNRLQKAAYS
jgi:L-threonylcarbamoyladenylate synthase